VVKSISGVTERIEGSAASIRASSTVISGRPAQGGALPSPISRTSVKSKRFTTKV